MMMGLGFWVMLLVLSVPILLVLGLLLLLLKPVLRQVFVPTAADPASNAPGAARISCSHCGAHLRADWAHCPQCGAPAQGRSHAGG